MQCSQVQETRGALSLLEEIETNSSSDSPVKKLSESSELLLSRCFFELLEAFLEFEPDSVLARSFVLLFFDRRVEVFDLFDFFDLVEFLDLRGRIVEMINKMTSYAHLARPMLQKDNKYFSVYTLKISDCR